MRAIIVSTGFALLAGVAFAQPVQKWVDKDGKVHYGIQPGAGAKREPISRGTHSVPGEWAQAHHRGPYAPGDSWTPDAKWTVTRSACRIVRVGG